MHVTARKEIEATMTVAERVGKYMSPPDCRSAIEFFLSTVRARQGTVNTDARQGMSDARLSKTLCMKCSRGDGRVRFSLSLCWHSHSRTGASLEARWKWLQCVQLCPADRVIYSRT